MNPMLPNGWLALGSSEHTIRLMDLGQRKQAISLEGHTGSIVSLKVLSNGNLVSYAQDNSVKIWNPYLTSNNLLLTILGHGNRGWSVPFGVLSNDFLVYCSQDLSSKEESNLRMWDPNEGKLVKHLQIGLTGVSTLLVLSNDQIAIGTENGTFKIIDLYRYENTRIKEKAHDEAVSCILQLSNDNLITAGQDKPFFSSIKVWSFADLSLSQNINTSHANSIVSMSISGDEAFLVTGSQDTTLTVWPMVNKVNNKNNTLDSWMDNFRRQLQSSFKPSP